MFLPLHSLKYIEDLRLLKLKDQRQFKLFKLYVSSIQPSDFKNVKDEV